MVLGGKRTTKGKGWCPLLHVQAARAAHTVCSRERPCLAPCPRISLKSDFASQSPQVSLTVCTSNVVYRVGGLEPHSVTSGGAGDSSQPGRQPCLRDVTRHSGGSAGCTHNSTERGQREAVLALLDSAHQLVSLEDFNLHPFAVTNHNREYNSSTNSESF